MNKKIIIAIDGHSSCGKSTMAKALAKKLNYIYVDTGAMYRTVALFAERNGLIANNDITNAEELKKILPEVEISFTKNNENQTVTTLNGVDVESEIRSLRISKIVSKISTLDFVREKLVFAQQELGKQKGIVMDGRDIGTVVFPNAELKIFLTASAEIRAQRRYDELTTKGEKVEYNDVLENVKSRDFIDENRDIAPLRKADDAFVLDNSNITREEQLEIALNKANALI